MDGEGIIVDKRKRKVIYFRKKEGLDMDFEKLNNQAREAQYFLVKEKGEKDFDAMMQDKSFVEYLVSYLEPYVEQVANTVIANNGQRETLTINVNDIVAGYPTTEYIIETYTEYVDESPIATMIWKLARSVQEVYQRKLPWCDISISPGSEFDDDSIDYMMIIKMSYYRERELRDLFITNGFED